MSSGNIQVAGSLITDGPLANIHANGAIQARSLSLNISGKITSSNDTTGMATRSFDYQSNLPTQNFVQIRALKVSEYLNTSILSDYYLLDANGSAIHRVQNQADQPLTIPNANLNFNGTQWEISGAMVSIDRPLVVETSFNIMTSTLFVAGTLMVQGNLSASGELNINTGTPFNKALIVDRNILVEKLVAIGRVHGSGTFTANGEVNILGNAEIDGDVSLFATAKINFLDNVYKAALSEAQQETNHDPYAASDPYAAATLMLVHSQLFSDAQNNNSVVMFTFVEGDYLLNENKLFQLIESNQINDFKFRTYLYGASMNFGAQLQKFDGLSPYYQNKLDLIKHLKTQGAAQVKLTESLDIAPANFYHSFEDAQGNPLGTYLVYSFASPFDINNLQTLSAAQRQQAVNNIINKDQLEAQRLIDAKQALIDQKQTINSDPLIDLYAKQEVTARIDEQLTTMQNTDVMAAKAEAKQGRVQEWLGYKELQASQETVAVNDVIATDSTAARRWWSRIVNVVRNVFSPAAYSCAPVYQSKTIYGVNNTDSWWGYMNDPWSQKIALNNNKNDYRAGCTPISAAMILNYHRTIKRGYSPLYSSWRGSPSRHTAATPGNNLLVDHMSGVFGTTVKGTWTLYHNVPWAMTAYMWAYGTPAISYSLPVWWPTRTAFHYALMYDITRNNPAIYSVADSVGIIPVRNTNNSIKYQAVRAHSMPVIGYRIEAYSGSLCWKRLLPNKRWLLVDSTWKSIYSWTNNTYGNSRAYLRFDSISQYWNVGTVTFIRAYW